jgi:16S rRNA (cytosine1407-C5)-methyltransferase
MDDLKKLPEKFLDRIDKIVPEGRKDGVLRSFCERRSTSFRANTLKISADDLEQYLQKQGVDFERIGWNTNAFVLTSESGNDVKSLTEVSLYKEGGFYIQSLSSMIPALVLDPKPNERILDIAAAPGSKTTQLAALMENGGEIVANDISSVRIYKLRANLQQQGVTNTRVTRIPGQLLWKKYPEYFDKALVDAPCSLEGRISCIDPKTYADWSVKRIEFLSQRERFLLRSAVSAVKPGGVIIYSTCTLAPEENEEVVNWILEREKGALRVESIDIAGFLVYRPIMKWRKQVFAPEVEKTVRILPSETMEGFFLAKIRKLRGTA